MYSNTSHVEASSCSFLMYGKPPINGATECQRSPHFVGIQARNDKLLHIMWFRALKKETKKIVSALLLFCARKSLVAPFTNMV